MAEVLLLSVAEAAERLGYSRVHTYDLIHSGRLHAIRPTSKGRWKVPVESLAEFIESAPVKSTDVDGAA